MAFPPSSKMSLDFLTQPDAQLREPAELAAALAKLDERLRESSIPYSDPLILDQEIVEADALLEDVVRTSKDPNFLENQKAQKILGFLEKLRIGAGAFGNHMLDEWGDLRRWPLLASLIKSQPWPRLERLELDNVTLTSGLLEELVGERSTDMIVRLESVFIDEEDEDTWREMLDMLRAKADPARPRKEGGVCGTVFVEALFAPYGGEIIDFLKRDIERIFGSRVRINDNAPLAPALSYLRGLRSKNPVPMVIGTPPLPPIHHLADDVAW
ncbi:hypothetical protein K4K61_009329 [Colletotrichum sp. SAR11_59]|nr:hypothetical protein K4K61_009329 [Colletotrichum sp. SAR11_59]